MNRKALETFLKTYRTLLDHQVALYTWVENCHRIILVADKANLPTPLDPHTLYLKKGGDSFAMHGHIGQQPLSADQHSSLLSLVSTWPKKTTSITESASVADIKNICRYFDPVSLNQARLWLNATEKLLSANAPASDIPFNQLWQIMQDQPNWLTDHGDTDPAPRRLVGPFYKKWFDQSVGEHHTFMGTLYTDIPFSQLLWLNGRYESAEEMLLSMQIKFTDGNDIFLDPNSTKRERFSEKERQLLTCHPTCKAFIEQYQAEQQRLAQIVLPEAFYDALHRYLMTLDFIGQQTQPWSFPDEKTSLCDEAQQGFFNTYIESCTEEQKTALAEAIEIQVPLRRSNNQSVSQKFHIVAQGIAPYDCHITRQIYLWAMYLAHRPMERAPEALLQHPQAEDYNLQFFDPSTSRSIIVLPPPLPTVHSTLATMSQPVSSTQAAMFDLGHLNPRHHLSQDRL